MAKIHKDMYIMEVLELDENLIPVFFAHGLHCIGCMLAHGETLEQACMVHNIDLYLLLMDLNDAYELDMEEMQAAQSQE